MVVLNYNYINSVEFKKFIASNHLIDSPKTLIQIFYSNSDEDLIQEVETLVKDIFKQSGIIATSTAGIINNSVIVDNTITISFSIFEEAKIASKGYKNNSFDFILEDLSKELITPQTKLLLIFANTFTLDSTNLLKHIHSKFPNIVVAGGNGADDYKFEKCYLYSKNQSDCDIVFASISSENLEIKTDFLFNWQTIGEAMEVTKSEGSTVYTIDNKSAISVYEEYLGKEVVGNLLLYGIEFPLIYQKEGKSIARALIAFDYDNGSITFAGEIPQNAEVRFGFANVDAIKDKNQQNLLNEFLFKQEAIYIYTCGSRRQTLGTFLNEEISMFKNFGDAIGFVTYGEFFCNQETCSKDLLNITTTFVALNEKKSSQKIKFKKEPIVHSIKDVRLTALTNLVKKTSEKLDENNYYLKQFRNAVDESSIYSTANALGIITDANKNFENISGYSKNELVGQNHNIVRHPDTPKSVFVKLWETIKAGNTWHGLVKNKRKDGSAYYVLSDVSPVYYRNGDFREYIGIRHDVSELEEYKILLKHELATTSQNLTDNLNYTKQYEKAVNTSVAIIKTDTKNIITYVNSKFLELTQYSEDEIIGMNCESIRAEHHQQNKECEQITKRLNKGEIVEVTLSNKSKYGKNFITKSIFYPIANTNGEIIEYIQVLNDITDIIQLNEEIQSTQREVVSTMGAIGETRSKETGLHVKRVAEYSYLLAILYGLNENDANLLKQASPMHDIGKVGIPDNILNKPGKLTFEEFEIMKSHAQLGYEMLKHSQRPILKASAVVAKEHHEKWDGSGYPNGLKGEEIHIFGRITAIADVFDALGHDRIYKKAWPLEEILNLFKEEKGKHFDPILVDLFFQHLEAFLSIKEKLED